MLVEWLALAVGIVASVTNTRAAPLAFVAAGLGAAWVVATTAIPLDVSRRGFVLDTLTLVGVALTMTAVVLTDGLSSPYVLLALTPSMYAGMFGGIRQSISVGALTAMLYLAIPLASNESWVTAIPFASLALALGAAVAQIDASSSNWTRGYRPPKPRRTHPTYGWNSSKTPTNSWLGSPKSPAATRSTQSRSVGRHSRRSPHSSPTAQEPLRWNRRTAPSWFRGSGPCPIRPTRRPFR